MWPRKSKRRNPDPPTHEQVEEALERSDVNEARRMRSEASWELRLLQSQNDNVVNLAERLIERRRQNHFGDEVQVTFTPRRSHG